MAKKKYTPTGKPRGRPVGTGKWGEPTKIMRVPLSKVDKVEEFIWNELNAENPIARDTMQTANVTEAAGDPSPKTDPNGPGSGPASS